MKQIGIIGTESRQGYRVYTSNDCGCAVVATPKGLSGYGGGLYLVKINSSKQKEIDNEANRKHRNT